MPGYDYRSVATDEAMRYERLRAQDGTPLVPPPNLEPLCRHGGLDPALSEDARQQWALARADIERAPSYPVEEKLFWTAFLLSRHYAEVGQRNRVDPLLRDTLPYLTQARHQQVLLGSRARNLACVGEPGRAAELLSQLDARSDDLQVDTNYRFTTAYVSLLAGDANPVLQVLGTTPGDVPISDAYDRICAVFRAHAHEALGHTDVALAQLRVLAPTPRDVERVAEIVQLTPQVPLLVQSLPALRSWVQQTHRNAVVTRSGIDVRRLVLIPLVLTLVTVASMAVFEGLLAPPLAEIVPGVLIAGLSLGSVGFAWHTLRRGARLRAQLRHRGVQGSAELLAVEQTGTRVNDQPMLRLRLLVYLPGHDPYAAVHREIVPLLRLPDVRPGISLPVRVDPVERRRMVIEWP